MQSFTMHTVFFTAATSGFLNPLDLTLTNICTLFLKALSSFRFARPIEGTSHIISGLFKSLP